MTATTAAEWYLVKYVPDLKRREPRNVGVLLHSPEGWLSKFLGETPDGDVNGRRLPHSLIRSTEVYKTWVDYYKRKTRDDAWNDIERMQGRRQANYYVETGGYLAQRPPSWEGELERLFSELVDDDTRSQSAAAVGEPQETQLTRLVAKVEQVFTSLGIQPEHKVLVPARFDKDTPLVTVPFRYSFVNGQKHLMDVVHQHTSPDLAAADARELRTRVEAARLAGSAQSFVTFYASSDLASKQMDQVLYPIERVSHAVDVDQKSGALEAMTTLMLR